MVHRCSEENTHCNQRNQKQLKVVNKGQNQLHKPYIVTPILEPIKSQTLQLNI